MGGAAAAEATSPIVFGVLGPLDVAGVDARRLGGAQQRALLADLIVHAGRVVSTAELITDLWGDQPPASADHTVEAYLSRLRRILADAALPATLETRRPGYRLVVDPDLVDVGRFRRLTAAASELGDAADERSARIEAEKLWRGEVLADLRTVPFVEPIAAALDDARLANIERRIHLDLEAGRHREIIADLVQLVQDHPDRESLTGLLMLALYRSGRQIDALAAYHRTRDRLVHEWGVEPGPELRAVEQAVLRHDPALFAAGSEPSGAVLQAPPDPEAGDRPDAVVPTRRRARRRGLLAGAVAAAILATVLALVAVSRAPRLSATAIPANGVGILGTDGRVRGALSLPVPPGAVVGGADAVWVSSPEGQRVVRVDPRTGRVVESVPAGAGAGELVVTGATVWVANTLDATLTRISSAANAAVQTIALGSQPAGLAVHGTSVLVALPNARRIAVIDDRSGRVERSVATDLPAFDLAVAAGSIWVTSPVAGIVERIDLTTGSVQARIPVGAGPEPILAAFGSLWVGNASDSTLTRIDPTSGAVVATMRVGDGPSALSSSGGRLWVANRTGGTVTGLDPASGRVTTTVPVGNRPQGLAGAGGRLWVAVRPGPTADHRGGTMRVLSEQPVDSTDPARAVGAAPPALLATLYDTLVTYRRTGTADGSQLVPDLAIAIPQPSANGLSYTFVLRPQLRYDTGAPVRPADFRYGLERAFMLNPAVGSYYSALRGAARCAVGATCDLSRAVITDDRARTITFQLSRPDPDLLYKLALVSAAPVPASVPMTASAAVVVPSTGPYRVGLFVSGHELVLVRNAAFRQWSAAAQPAGFPDRIVWTFGMPVAAEAHAVEVGRADWLNDPPPDPALLAARFPTRAHIDPLLGIGYLAFNVTAAPFDDARVRQAVSLAADRRDVVAAMGGSLQAQPTCQVIPPDLIGYRPYCPFSAGDGTGTWLGPDLARARRLVAQSGTQGMRVTLFEHSADVALGHASGRILTALGYRVRIRTLADDRWAGVVDDSRRHAQVTVGQWIVDFPSPSDFFQLFLACDASRVGDPQQTRSASFFCNHDIDRHMAAAASAGFTDPATAARLWARVDREITRAAPWVPLVSLKATDFVSARVGNYTYNPALGMLVDQAWVR